MQTFAEKPRARIHPVAILRDILLVWAWLLFAGLVAIVLAMAMTSDLISSSIAEIIAVPIAVVLGAAGFAISGHLTPVGRWKHLCLVAIGVWLLFGLQTMSDFDWAGWTTTALYIALSMGLGGGASYFIKSS